MDVKKNKSAIKFFIYGLFLGLVIGVILSLMGIPQTVGSALAASRGDFKADTKIDEVNRTVKITVSGNITNDKEFEELYLFGVNKVESMIKEKGIVDCDTKIAFTKSDKIEQINSLKAGKSSILTYAKANAFEKIYNETNNLTSNDVSKLDEDTLYFSCPPDCGGDGDTDLIPPVDPPTPPIGPNCSGCGESSTGVCMMGVCGTGTVDVTGCIIEGQKALLASGEYVSVENLFVGDKVMSYNLNTKKMEVDEITFKSTNVPNDYYRINDNLELTPDHLVYVIDKGFIETQNIVINKDYILENGNPVLVISKEFIKNKIKNIYTFSVKNNKNLIINGVVVHNALPQLTMPKIKGASISFTLHF